MRRLTLVLSLLARRSPWPRHGVRRRQRSAAGDGLRARGRRLGPRRRDEPVGRVRPGEGGRGYREILAYYYRGTEFGAAPAAVSRRCASSSATASARSPVTSSACVASSTQRQAIPAARGVDARPEARTAGRRGRQAEGRSPARSRFTPDRRAPPSSLAGQGAIAASRISRAAARRCSSSTRSASRPTSSASSRARCRRTGRSRRSRPRRSPRARTRSRASSRASLRPLLRLAQPGVLRRRLEAPGTTRAVRETRGEILTYEGKVAQVFYFSSSGGRTLSALDVFGLGRPVPRLRRGSLGRDARRTTAGRAAALRRQVAKRVRARRDRRRRVARAGHAGRPAVLRLTTTAGGDERAPPERRAGAARPPVDRRSGSACCASTRRRSPRVPSGPARARRASRATSSAGARAARARGRLGAGQARPARAGRHVRGQASDRRRRPVPAHRRRARRAAPSPSGSPRDPARRRSARR